jgi:hypothetical protein
MRAPHRIFPRQIRRILFCALLSCVAGVLPSRGQSSGQLPQKWDESLRALADNIAAVASPSKTISLEVKNVSSLGQADAGAIRHELESDLVHKGFHVDAAPAPEVHVQVTLSESAERYVWIAETHLGDGDKVSIVDVAKERDSSAEKQMASLVLDRKLVWQQPGKILDFAVFRGIDAANSTLWILEPERLSMYRNAGELWEFDFARAINHRASWPRDLRGIIDALQMSITLPGLECVLKSSPQNDLQCETVELGKGGAPTVDPPESKIEGHEGSDSLALRSACGGDSVVVATGAGDWTQPDSIQAYLEKDGRAVSSGDPLQTDGPVVAMNWDEPGVARVVVHNLKTGNYEAYIVTATCSH